MSMEEKELKSWIRDIPDFPEKGIMFRDITPALLNGGIFRKICDSLVERYSGAEIDKIAGIESRGFFFSAVLSYRLGKGLIPLRKPGKLPFETVSESYSLEYGSASLEMHTDAVKKGERILIVDDLLATGGTAAAAAKLIERQGGIVDELLFIIELSGLKGASKLGGRRYFSLISY